MQRSCTRVAFWRAAGRGLRVGAILAAAALAGCGGGHAGSSGGMPFSPVSQTGRVVLPAGCTASLSSLRIATSRGSTPVDASGAFAAPIYAGGPQFAMALGPTGRPMLLGWVDGAHTEITARTTADVLLYFNLACFWLTGAQRVHAIDLIAASADGDAIARAVSDALIAHPDGLPDADAALTAALDHAGALALATRAAPAAAAARGRDIVIDPSAIRSGLSVLNGGGGVNSFYVQNGYRRRAHAFVDRVSYVRTADSATVPWEGSVTAFEVAPVPGATTLVSTIAGMLAGTPAGTPTVSSTVELAIPDDAKRATYRLTAVGIGASAGDTGQLTQAQRDMQRLVGLRTVVCDFLLPLIANTLVPVGGDRIDDFMVLTHGSDLLQDAVNALGVDAPQVAEKLAAGNVKDALWAALQTVTSSNTLRRTLIEVIRAYVLTSAESAMSFAQLSNHVLSVLSGVDAGLTAIDTIVQGVNYAQSNRADIWSVTAARAKIGITPEAGTATTGLSADFTCTGAGGTSTVIQYVWSTPGLYGHLEDDRGHSGTSFTSIASTVRYVANATARDGDTDTINVTANAVQGSKFTELGKATATVVVVDSKRDVTILPASQDCDYGSSVGLQVSVLPSLPYGTTVEYVWTATSTCGNLVDGSGNNAPFTKVTPDAAYTAGQTPGSDTATVTVVRTISGGRKVTVGTATATIRTRDPSVATHIGTWQENDWIPTTTSPPYQFAKSIGVYAAWKVDETLSGYVITVHKPGVADQPFYQSRQILMASTLRPRLAADEVGTYLFVAAASWEKDILDTDPSPPPPGTWAEKMPEFNAAQGYTVTVVGVR